MSIAAKRQKYGNRKAVVDGLTFDSQAESRRYLMLKMLQKSRRIEKLETQVKFDICVSGTKICSYIADFRYWCNTRKKTVVEDVKGVKTPVYRLKKKLVKAVYDIDIVEVAA